MKQSVQILFFIVGLIPVFVGAREETMEERKQRITRKYLRERAEMTYSEMAVPDEKAVREEVLASEKFKQPQVDFQRQEGGAAMPKPPMRRPAPPAENSNWLLSDNPELANPYADPFALKDSQEESNKKTDWTTWGAEQNSSSDAATPVKSRFDRREIYGSSANPQTRGYDSLRQGFVNPRDPRSTSTEGMWSGHLQEGTTQGYRSLFGRQQDSQAPASMGSLDLSRDKTINSTLNQTRLQSPFPRETQSGSTEFREGGQSGTGSYTPYKSSFQIQREQRQQQWRGYGDAQPEFQKQNTFQQWKERNPARYDPTSDDAFIQEMMPKTRR